MKKLLSLLLTASLLLPYPAYAVKINGPLEGAVLENSASDLANKEGRIYYNTVSKKPKFYNGSAWTEVGSGSSSGSGVTSVAQARLMGQVKITGCSTAWSTTSVSMAAFSAGTNCVYTATGSALAPATNIPGIKFASLPAGNYILKYEGFILANYSSVSAVASFQFWDGTNTALEVSNGGNANASFNQTGGGIQQTISYASPQTNVTLSIRGMTGNAGTAAQIFGTTANPGVISVYYFPREADLVTQPSGVVDRTGEVIAIAGTCPANTISGDTKSIGISGADYNGTDYLKLYRKLWALPSLCVNNVPAGCGSVPGYRLSGASGKGATADVDWAAGRTITAALSGAFIRGIGGDAAGLGSGQDDAFQGHWHDVTEPGNNEALVLGAGVGGVNSAYATWSSASTRTYKAKNIITNGSNGTPRIASETHPDNATHSLCVNYTGSEAVPQVVTDLIKSETQNFIVGGNAETAAEWVCSGSATMVSSQTAPLAGSASWIYTPGAATNTCYLPFTIGAGYQARAIGINLDFALNSGTVADGDVVVEVFDTINNATIQPDRTKIPAISGTLAAPWATSFTTAYNSTEYRLVLKRAAGTGTLKLDNIKVSSAPPSVGAIITEWQAFTTTGSFTNATYSGKKRRVGDTAEYDMVVSLTGTPATAELTVNLPGGDIIDTAKLGSIDEGKSLGEIETVDTGAGFAPGRVWYYSTTAVRAVFIDVPSVNKNASIDYVTQAKPQTWATGDKLHLRFRVPIVGWTTGQITTAQIFDLFDSIQMRFGSCRSNEVSALNKIVGKASGDYQGDTYYRLYSLLWGLPGLSTSAGYGIVISSAKGASAAADWTAGKTITLDFRDLFLRGVGTANANLGAYQADAMQGHLHAVPSGASNYVATKPGAGTSAPAGGNSLDAFPNTGAPSSDGVNGTPRTASETRPKDIAVNFCIPYDTAVPATVFAGNPATDLGGASSSDYDIPSQKAVKTYVDTTNTTRPINSAAAAQRIETAFITCTSTPSVSPTGGWLTGISHPATGRCTISVAAGLFSSAPNCVSTVNNGGAGNNYVSQTSASTTSINLGIASGGTAADAGAFLICMGPK